MLLTMLLAWPTGVWAAGGETTASVPIWLCIPFAGLLLCIAIMPLVKAEWWEAHQPHVVAMWILLMVIPFAVVYGVGDAAETVLDCIINDYLTFIILLLDCSVYPVTLPWRAILQVLHELTSAFWHSVHCYPAVSEQQVPVC